MMLIVIVHSFIPMASSDPLQAGSLPSGEDGPIQAKLQEVAGDQEIGKSIGL